MINNEYQCENCKGIFEKGWTDKEADAETEYYFGVKDATSRIGKDMVVVWDDCFQKIHPEKNLDLVEKSKQELKIHEMFNPNLKEG